MSGFPLLPPSSTGCDGSRARIVAIKLLVVLFPFVPVTPTRQRLPRSRSAHSGSLIRRRPRAPPSPTSGIAPAAKVRRSRSMAGRTVGNPSVTAGLCTTRSASARSGARFSASPNEVRIPLPANASVAPTTRSIVSVSCTVTLAPAAAANAAVAWPVRPPPRMTTLRPRRLPAAMAGASRSARVRPSPLIPALVLPGR